jgi:hypothetical protein
MLAFGKCKSVLPAVSLALLLAATGGAVSTAQSAGPQASGGGRGVSDSLFKAFNGARLGMAAEEVRQILGKPEEQDDAQDYYSLSETRQIRVYYDGDGKANALVASFVGAQSGAPSAEEILGTPVEPGANGSTSGSILRPEEGYRVSYSRTPGDTPMVFITVQKL